MRHLMTFLFILFSFQINFAQKAWSGGAGTSSWHDDNNWNPFGVPSITDDVNIEVLAPFVTITITAAAVAKSIRLRHENILSLSNGSSLTIDGSNQNGIEITDEGSIINSGTINISNTLLSGLAVGSESTFTNHSDGTINISNTTSHGILNVGSLALFENSGGTIHMLTGIGGIGIVNQEEATFNNLLSGELRIENTGAMAISNGDVNTTFENRGIITIDNPGNLGIRNLLGASFENLAGSINILTSPAGSIQNEDENTNFINDAPIVIGGMGAGIGFGIFNLSQAQFSNSSSIDLNGAGKGIVNDGVNSQFLNTGNITSTIEITVVGFENRNHGIVNNEGTITLSSSSQSGCDNHDSAIFNNQNGASLNISNCQDYGFENNGNAVLNNHGTMTLANDNWGIDIRSNATLNNFGIIDIENYDLFGIYSDGGNITNSSIASIDIDNSTSSSSSFGFSLRDCNVINEGVINISNTAPSPLSGTGIALEQDCTFENAMGATINIQDIAVGFLLIPDISQNNTFDNKGIIQLSKVGLGIQTRNGNANFINASSGFILLSETDGYALAIQGNGRFENSGSVINNFDLGINQGSCMIVNETGTFDNKPSGFFICVIDPTDNEPGVLIESAATFSGTGVVEFQAPPAYPFPYLLNEGTFAPGASPGTTSITGNLDLVATSKYEAELEGTAAGEFDVIAVDGDLELDGTLEVSLLSGFVPTNSDRFSIMTYTGSLTGTFSTVTLPASMSAWDVDYGTTTAGEIELFYNPALPVEWVSFDVKLMGAQAKLNWTTASETNTSHFIIEKSADASSWEMIGNISAQGNSTIEHRYSFLDKNLKNGITYYRIQQVDLDGKFSYSTIESIVFGKENTIRVFPNPSSDFVFIENIKDVFQINIYHSEGKLVKELDLKNEEGIYKIKVTNLPKGSYVLEIKSTYKLKEIRRFIKI